MTRPFLDTRPIELAGEIARQQIIGSHRNPHPDQTLEHKAWVYGYTKRDYELWLDPRSLPSRRDPTVSVPSPEAKPTSAVESPPPLFLSENLPPVAVHLMAGYGPFDVEGGLLTLRKTGPLGEAGESLLVNFDKVMFPIIFDRSGWQIEDVEFMSSHVDINQTYALIDIGANIGLFTRQISNRLSSISKYVCVETDPSHFKALCYNLSDISGESCEKWNVALSDREGSQEFYRDASNIGNYSMNASAMHDTKFNTSSVKTVNTTSWMEDFLSRMTENRLLWKSDTQGYDELIVSLTPMALWQRVDVALIELWRIEKPAFDRDAFRARIEQFPYKTIGSDWLASTEEVLDYAEGLDGKQEDLHLWR